jgi:hypothetical protein
VAQTQTFSSNPNANQNNPGGGPVSLTQFSNATAEGADISADALAATGVGAPVAAAVATVGNLLAGIVKMFGGCGQTCVQATAYANQAGAIITQAFQTYMQSPIHFYSAQQTFVNGFDIVMQKLVAACSNPNLGSAGRNCVSDNSRGACKWMSSPGGGSTDLNGNAVFTYWGANGSGTTCWNPYLIRDAVAADPTVVADGTAISGGPVTVGSNSTTFATPVPVTAPTTALGSIQSTLASLTPIEVGAISVAIILGLLVFSELIEDY